MRCVNSLIEANISQLAQTFSETFAFQSPSQMGRWCKGRRVSLVHTANRVFFFWSSDSLMSALLSKVYWRKWDGLKFGREMTFYCVPFKMLAPFPNGPRKNYFEILRTALIESQREKELVNWVGWNADSSSNRSAQGWGLGRESIVCEIQSLDSSFRFRWTFRLSRERNERFVTRYTRSVRNPDWPDCIMPWIERKLESVSFSYIRSKFKFWTVLWIYGNLEHIAMS